MPEPIEAVHGEQDQRDASTPAANVQLDKPTIVKTSEESGPSKNLMDLLDIPPEVQQRVGPKATPATHERSDAGRAQDRPEQPELPVPEKKNEEPEELKPDEDEEEAEEELPTAAVDKRQKRINRLTRKKAELETQLDSIAAENYKLREVLQKAQAQEPGQGPAPLTGERVSAIQNEIAKLDATLEWCDNNIEGAEIGEGDKTQYYDAKAIRAWRRDAELKRQRAVIDQDKELQQLAYVRQQADQQAIALWPEMFDKSKPEYQEAVAIIRQYPFITMIPEANYALGLFIEAGRSLKAKATHSTLGNHQSAGQKQHRDIDERVFTTPRVPIAPHTPEPPTRESTPSSHKTLNEAMSRLAKDPDGGVENLSAVFAALEKTRQARPTSRTPVRS